MNGMSTTYHYQPSSHITIYYYQVLQFHQPLSIEEAKTNLAPKTNALTKLAMYALGVQNTKRKVELQQRHHHHDYLQEAHWSRILCGHEGTHLWTYGGHSTCPTWGGSLWQGSPQLSCSRCERDRSPLWTSTMPLQGWMITQFSMLTMCSMSARKKERKR